MRDVGSRYEQTVEGLRTNLRHDLTTREKTMERGGFYLPQSCFVAKRAPSAIAWNFAQAILGWFTLVPMPQSVPAMTFSFPTSLAKFTRRSAIACGCSMKSL